MFCVVFKVDLWKKKWFSFKSVCSLETACQYKEFAKKLLKNSCAETIKELLNGISTSRVSNIRSLHELRGCIQAYYKNKPNLKVKIFCYSTYSSLSWMHLLHRTFNAFRPFTNKILSCSANQASTTFSLKENWRSYKLFLSSRKTKTRLDNFPRFISTTFSRRMVGNVG